MDGGLVNSSSSTKTKNTENSYTKVFEKVFPYYLSVGMSVSEFWEGDPKLTEYYRKANQIKQSQENTKAWLQGKYFYDALLMVAPVYHAFAKQNVEPIPYHDEPFPITVEEKQQLVKKQQAQATSQAKAFMENFMAQHNAKFSRGD